MSQRGTITSRLFLQLAEEIAAARLRAAIARGQGNASAGDGAV
jgi:hypothetical protein